MRTDSGPDLTTSPSTVALPQILSDLEGDGDAALASSVRQASVVLLPLDLGDLYDKSAFPICTVEMCDYLSDALGDEGRVVVASTEESYREADFRSEDLFLPVLYVIDPVIVELAVRTVVGFVFDYFSLPQRSLSESTVRSELHVTSTNGTILYHKYDGPASTFESIIPMVLRKSDDADDSGR